MVGVSSLAALLSACAHPTVPPIGAGGQPFQPAVDERALWAEGDREEQALFRTARRYTDPLLDAYLARIAERLLPASVRAASGLALRLGVIGDPTLSAFGLPSGSIYLHTGLMSRLDNEAQLATVIAREITHVVERHALVSRREARDGGSIPTIVAASMSSASGALSRSSAGDGGAEALLTPTARAILGGKLELLALAAISGYGRRLEREADRGGLDKLVQAGYDPSQAVEVFERLQQEGDRGGLETFFLGNRSALADRAATMRRLVERSRPRTSSTTVGAITEDEEFHRRMRSVVRDNALFDIQAGRFVLARRQLDHVLSITPADPLAHLHYGELYRLESQRTRRVDERNRYLQLALESYQKSIGLEPGLADAYRQLGLLYYEQKDSARARDAFAKYLALRPDAPDARRVQEYLGTLGPRPDGSGGT